MQHRVVISGSAVTATTRASPGNVTIPGAKGQGGVLVGVEVIIYPTDETVVNSGGLIELINDSVDWTPFQFYTGGVTCVTEGGAQIAVFFYPCHKKLPEGSKITAYYTPQDNQSQKCKIVLIYDTDERFVPSKETYAMSGIGSAITQATIASDHVTISIPAGKGGIAKALQLVVFGTLETVVNSGGLVTVKNKSADPSPFDLFTKGVTCVDAGGALIEIQTEPCDFKVPGKSDFKLDYTPEDNQSQQLASALWWTPSGN